MKQELQNRQDRIIAIRDLFISLMWIHHRQFSHRLQTFDLTRPQFITLTSLVAHKWPCTMRDLTDVTFQDAPTMTGIVNRLIKMGLVERTRSQVDRRVVLVQATESGIELVKRIEEEMLADDLCGYAALTNEELTALEQLATYILRMYLKRYTDAQDVDLEEAMEKFKLFKQDPIYYARLHNGRLHEEGLFDEDSPLEDEDSPLEMETQTEEDVKPQTVAN